MNNGWTIKILFQIGKKTLAFVEKVVLPVIIVVKLCSNTWKDVLKKELCSQHVIITD